jgi:nitrate/nitrite-specific signal transduction histidine kinase
LKVGLRLYTELITALHERAAAEPAQAAEVLPELLEDLQTALEELHVAEEEQYQQNETLAAARLTAEAELQRMNAQLQVEIGERQCAADKAQRAEQALRSSREQLRQLATHLQNAQEQERAHIARELHDDLAQALTSLRLDVSWLTGRALTALAVWRERLTSIGAAIDALHQTVRRIGTELRPRSLRPWLPGPVMSCYSIFLCLAEMV